MAEKDLKKILSENPYPGRGIIIGLSDDGSAAILAYFIMGRSANSRNRVFELFDGGMRTKAFDDSKVTDPSLIIYAPYRHFESGSDSFEIVTNGDQTDTIYEYLRKNPSEADAAFRDALATRSFEPDAPNYTPRISGIAKIGDTFGYSLSILKADSNTLECGRFFFDYTPKPGTGHFIHTYRCDGDPLPSFEGEPEEVELKGSAEDIAGLIWDSLNCENKVSIFVREVPLKGGAARNIVINKNS